MDSAIITRGLGQVDRLFAKANGAVLLDTRQPRQDILQKNYIFITLVYNACGPVGGGGAFFCPRAARSASSFARVAGSKPQQKPGGCGGGTSLISPRALRAKYSPSACNCRRSSVPSRKPLTGLTRSAARGPARCAASSRHLSALARCHRSPAGKHPASGPAGRPCRRRLRWRYRIDAFR